MNRWRHKLDTNLPGELGQIADWINTAETILARGVNFDPLTLTPEDNVQRFTKLNEEHAVYFVFFFEFQFEFSCCLIQGDIYR